MSGTTIIQIAGIIGAGKTTLASLLSNQLGWTTLLETVYEVPHFSVFNKDLVHWGLHQQLSFLLRDIKVQQDSLKDLQSLEKPLVQDWMFEEHFWIFTRALLHQGYMGELDGKLFEELCTRIGRFLLKPNYVIFLDISPEIALERLVRRRKALDETFTLSYLYLLRGLYKDLFEEFCTCPVLHINVNQLDFLNIESDKQEVVRQILKFIRI